MSVVVWWLVTVVMVAVHSASAGVVELNWEVEYKLRWPDCKEGIVIAINGEFPGPTIDATAGDTFIIHVTNKLSTEGVVIHWHGIRQNGTPWADGAAGVTQCPINPGETFTYNFIVDKAGTHFYHGHYGMQRSAGLYGMMIVRSPKETLQYDGEFNLLLSDWWHQGSHAQELYLSSRPMRWIGEPQSLLINGRGQFNCSLAAYFNEGGLKECKFKDNDDCAPTILRVEPLKVYRLRIASTTALASLNLAVELQAFVSARFVLKPSLALAGTHFYHGHYGMQRSAGLYGMMVVRSPKETLQYDGEFNLLLSDWWHLSSTLQELSLSSKPMRWIGEPQSLLINGRGQFDCSQAGYFNEGGLKECNFTKDDPCAPTTLRVEPNKVYRLRIASTTSLASLNLAVEYWISVGVRGRKPNTPQALTVLHYAGASESERLPFPPRETPRWDDFNRSKNFSKKIFAAKGYPPPPEKSNAQLFLLNTQNLMEGYTKWAINNLSLSVPATPYIGSIRYGLPLEYLKFPGPEIIENYDINHPPVNPNTTVSSGIYNLTMGMVVDVILQNSNVLKGEISEVHPWHLHGHDFWVLGYGEGKFQPGVDDKRYNLTNAPLRNTVALYPYGWTALRFVTDNPGPGTHFYHGHYGMQRSAGLYGSLIIDAAKGKIEPLRYDGEFNLLLSDWWHESVLSQELGLSAKPMRWIGEAQSILINGRGQFNCSLAAQFSKATAQFSNTSLPMCKFKKGDQCAPQRLHVEPNKTYRIRLASTTGLASLNFAVQGHKLVVVEADGNYITPFATSDVDIYSGESYSVLLTTDQDPSQNYWISVGVRGRKPKTPPALTVLHYVTAPSSQPPSSPPPETPRWNDFDRSRNFSKRIFSAMGSPPPPRKFKKRLILLNTQNMIDGATKWALNNVSLVVPATPYLGSVKYKLRRGFDRKSPPTTFPMDYDIMNPPRNRNTTKGNGIYVFPFNVTVDVILQNANGLDANASEIHPWHLHGHDFWVLGYGEGKFRPGIDEKTYNLKNPPLRNTVALYPYGWTALRFVTDNPGVWFFHCHIEPHLHMGMGVVFAEGLNRIGKVPDEALGCGLTKQFLMNRNNP
ncbi:unnamed protein product [Brassica rapa subsp. trilocularis]